MFFVIAALCIAYFVAIVVYSGIGTSFVCIWPVISVVFLLIGVFENKRQQQKEEMPKRLPAFLYTTFSIGVLTAFFMMIFILNEANKVPSGGCDYVIVMGGRVYDDGISTTLKKRLDTAILYSEENPDTVFVLSGGIEKKNKLPEALAMYNYMILNGIDESRLLIESSSSSTADNIKNSLMVIEEDLKKRRIPPPLRIGLCSSDYHMLRSQLVAGKSYNDRIYGIPAPSDGLLFIHMCVRECCALVKDRLIGNL